MTRLGIRWGRAALVNAAGIAILAFLLSQMFAGRVAGLGAGLIVQTEAAEFSTARLNTSNVAFAMNPITLRSGTSSTSSKYVLRFGLANGNLDGFCVSKSRTVLGVPYTLRLTSRNGALNSYDVSGKNLQFDVTTVTSTNTPNTSGNGIELKGNVLMGVTTQSVTTWLNAAGTADEPNPLDGPGNYTGINGRLFGVDSAHADLYNLKGDIYNAFIEGPIDIMNLKIEVVQGAASTQGCKAIPIGY